jgi:hypothetical protein
VYGDSCSTSAAMGESTASINHGGERPAANENLISWLFSGMAAIQPHATG